MKKQCDNTARIGWIFPYALTLFSHASWNYEIRAEMVLQLFNI